VKLSPCRNSFGSPAQIAWRSVCPRKAGIIFTKLITLLNLAWLLLALSGLAVLGISERKRIATSGARIRRVVSVVLVTVSLFPCVSASDDLINFAYVRAGLETRSGFGHSAPTNSEGANTVLYLALQALEHLQVAAVYTLLLALCFFGFISYSAPRSFLRQTPSFVGRAPPQTEFFG